MALVTAATGWPNPDPFPFTKSAEWPKWKRRFDRYRIVSGLEKKTDIEQINALIYCMGDQADDIFLTLNLSIEQKSNYATVLQEFENYFIVKRNIIYERATFNRRVQQEHEHVDEFITSLYALAEYCEFGSLKNEFIRDRIVVGIRDQRLSEQMQLHSDLTLERAVVMAKQSELVKKQNPYLHQHQQQLETSLEVHRVKTKPKPFDSKEQAYVKHKHYLATDKANPERCGRCDGEKHSLKNCPAAKAICNACKRIGHYARACRSKGNKKIRAVHSNDDAFVGKIRNQHVSKSTKDDWNVTVEIQNVSVSVKADTGAETSCIPFKLYNELFNKILLREPTRRLYDANNQSLKVVGTFKEIIRYGNNSTETEIYVVKGLAAPLLDGNTCENLKILKRINTVDTKSDVKMSFNPIENYPNVFQGLGQIKTPYTIRLRDDAVPYALTTPRRIPIPKLDEIKQELANMVEMGVIEPVEQPTDWCAGMVLVPKPNGKTRICVDYTHLNKYVRREVHPMPSTENILGRLGKAKYFSKIDANHGFWQCELDEESQLLTTFITPFGRYKFKRLPFGISAAPEFFQKRMSEIVKDLEGVLCNVDDILVYADTAQEHDARLRAVLRKLSEAGVTLNGDKCIFGALKVKFLGHIIDQEGIHIDDERIQAIKDMEAPQNVPELRSLLGTVNYLGKFVPHLATKARPLNDLLSPQNEFIWGESQSSAFEELKQELIRSPTLAWFDPTKETVISADASSYGVGAVLKQKQENGKYRPVAYASKTLTASQRNWAQIEKEGYALVWACERFKNYIIGLNITLETDHKPLIPIFSTKPLDEITPKLQRMRLRLNAYSYTIKHVPGKELGAADILSRKPLASREDDELDDKINVYIQSVLNSLPATDERLGEIINAQQNDDVCQELIRFSQHGWPNKASLPQKTTTYWQYREQIAVENGLLMMGSRIVIPTCLREDILNKIHEGHLGITKCRARIQSSVWWPGVSKEIETLIKNCTECITEASNRHEPLISSEFPQLPWQKIAIDLFYLEKKWYLLVTDYYSRYPEIALLNDLKENEIIVHLKSIFAKHGIPTVVYSDKGTHFGPTLSSQFAKFAKEWGFKHVTSSPKFPQSNGLAESVVKIIKRTLKKSKDPYLALLSYRATPLSNGFSPAELLMGRKLRTLIPSTESQLRPKVPDQNIIRHREERRRHKQRKDYNRRHGVRPLPELHIGDKVWITDLRRTGTISGRREAPRSYMIRTDRGREVCRNRFHLIPVKLGEHDTDVETDVDTDVEIDVET